MKTLRLVSASVLIALSAVISTAHAKVPPLLPVPDYLSDSVKRDLTSQREVLEQRIVALRKWADDFNAKCGGRTLSEDDPAAKDCLNEKAKLDQAGQNYSRDALAFDDEVLKATAIGSIGESRGEFYIVTPDGRGLTGDDAAKGFLNKGSRVVTGADGRIQLKLQDQTTFTIGPNSDMVVDEYDYDPDPSLRKLTVAFAKGVCRWVTAKANQLHSSDTGFKIKTQTLVLTIRGTDFELSVQPDGTGYVKLFSGKLEITQKKDGEKIQPGRRASGEV